MNVIVIQTQVNCNYSNYCSFNKVQMHVSKSSWVLHYTNKKATKPYDGSAANLLGSLFYNKEYDYSVFHVDGNTTKEFSVKLTKITIIVLIFQSAQKLMLQKVDILGNIAIFAHCILAHISSPSVQTECCSSYSVKRQFINNH